MKISKILSITLFIISFNINAAEEKKERKQISKAALENSKGLSIQSENVRFCPK